MTIHIRRFVAVADRAAPSTEQSGRVSPGDLGPVEIETSWLPEGQFGDTVNEPGRWQRQFVSSTPDKAAKWPAVSARISQQRRPTINVDTTGTIPSSTPMVCRESASGDCEPLHGRGRLQGDPLQPGMIADRKWLNVEKCAQDLLIQRFTSGLVIPDEVASVHGPGTKLPADMFRDGRRDGGQCHETSLPLRQLQLDH